MFEETMNLDSGTLSAREMNERMGRAVLLRKAILPAETTAYRLVNSSGDGLPGLFVDVYGTVAVCQIEARPISTMKEELVACLREHVNLEAVFEKSDTARAIGRGLEACGVLWGRVPQVIECLERGVTLLVDPRMAKTGYFLDLRECRAFLESQSRGARILNCFAFTGSIGVFALRGGAEHVVHVEKRLEAIELAKQICKANRCDLRYSRFECQDVMTFLQSEDSRGVKYDIVVIDPPEFAVRPDVSGRIRERYRSLNERALRLVKPGGMLMTTCCSHGFGAGDFEDVLRSVLASDIGSPTLVWSGGAPADHPLSVDDPSLDYLRMLSFRVE